MPISRERLKTYTRLKQKKFRSLQKQCIIEGIRAIRDIVTADNEGLVIEALLYTPEFVRDDMHEKLLLTARERGARIYEIEKKEMERMTETVSPQEIVAIIHQWGTTVDTIVHQSAAQFIVATDNIREPGNLGALIRTCDWFGVDALLLGKGTVDIWNPKVLRAAVGSMIHLPFVEDVDLTAKLPVLRSHGYFITGTSVHEGVSIAETIPVPPLVILFGNEAEGISPELLNLVDELMTIPKFGKAESLNVGTAAGVILSAIRFSSK
jgi:RNA methyltransferase, TrmH family